MTEIQKFIAKYCKIDYSVIKYDEICFDLEKLLVDKIPQPSVLIENQIIERLRYNDENCFFNSESEISIRTDLKNIREFGRVNNIGQSRFYGAINDGKMNARAAIIAETCKSLRNRDYENNYFNYFTLGHWRIEQPLRLAILSFKEESFQIKRIKEATEYFKKEIKKSFENHEEIIELLCFFSNQFAKPVKNPLEYKLTAAFGNFFIDKFDLDGVLYPSVQLDYSAENIALSCNGVKKLKLIRADLHKLIIRKNRVRSEPIFTTENKKIVTGEFEWLRVIDKSRK